MCVSTHNHLYIIKSSMFSYYKMIYQVINDLTEQATFYWLMNIDNFHRDVIAVTMCYWINLP